jgi:hypothetical protein
LGHLAGHHHAATQPAPEPAAEPTESNDTKQL